MPEVTALTRRFEAADERREFTLGHIDMLNVGGVTLGRAEYAPGWRWSEHVGKERGERSCQVAHIGYVVSGHNRVVMDDGRVLDLGPGDVFDIGPGHDSWVVGEERYVSIHFVGTEHYART
jgi:quercetin dioxygenase-like cupin family protein